MTNGNKRKQMDKAVEAFMQLGFPRYESLILAVLSAAGTSTVKEIHQQTDIPLPKVYQTLEILSRKNFIKHHTKTRPIMYTTYSPDILIRKIQDENRSAENNLQTELSKLRISSPPSFAGDIAPYSDIEEMLRIGKAIIQNEHKQLSVAMSTNTLSLFKEELEEAKTRNVNLRSLSISQIQKATSAMDPAVYRELGFNQQQIVDLPIKMKLDVGFLKILKNVGDIVDYLGIMISDHGESLIILPLFPDERYFGIWIYNSEIVSRQLAVYDMFYDL